MNSVGLMGLALVSALTVSFACATARADSWRQINNPDEIRKLIVDRVLDGKYWKFYFRSDGKMAYEQGGFISIREWRIDTNGAICMNIYSMPDKSLGCEIFSITDGMPAKYRLQGKTGQNTVHIIDPGQALVDAVMEKAGPVE